MGILMVASGKSCRVIENTKVQLYFNEHWNEANSLNLIHQVLPDT